MKIELTKGVYISEICDTWDSSDCKYKVYVIINDKNIGLWDISRELRKRFNYVEFLWDNCFLCDVKDKDWAKSHFEYNKETGRYERL